MNRITQCLHGKGTISTMMAGSDKKEIRQEYLAYSPVIRPVIFWNLTGRCNLSCMHCYNSSGSDQESYTELTTDEAHSFIDDCAGLNVPVILFSGGEPLLRSDLFELATHAKEKRIKTALSTNGTLITQEIAEKIRESGIGYVGISLDGATSKTHDRFRNCQGAFDPAIRAFSYCNDAKIRCGVRVTLTKANYHELKDLIDLSLTIGACRFCLYWLVPSGRGTGSYVNLQLSASEVFSALDLLHEYASKTDPSVIEFLTVDGPQDAICLLSLMEQKNSPDLPDARSLIASMKGGCSAGIRVASVTQHGDVYPCQFAQIPECHVGSIRTRKFSELWNDKDNPVLKRFRNKKEMLKGRCASCSYLDLCGGGCRVRAFFQKKDFSDDDPFCFIKD